MMNGPGKSDSAIVAERPTNKAGRPAEEPEERRAETEGNAVQQSTRRAQNRESVSQALDRIRQAARQRKKEKFTALLRHISPEHLEAAFFELKENAAPGGRLHTQTGRSATPTRGCDVGCIMHLVQFGFGDGEARRGDLATQSRRL